LILLLWHCTTSRTCSFFRTHIIPLSRPSLQCLLHLFLVGDFSFPVDPSLKQTSLPVSPPFPNRLVFLPIVFEVPRQVPSPLLAPFCFSMSVPLPLSPTVFGLTLQFDDLCYLFEDLIKRLSGGPFFSYLSFTSSIFFFLLRYALFPRPLVRFFFYSYSWFLVTPLEL